MIQLSTRTPQPLPRAVRNFLMPNEQVHSVVRMHPAEIVSSALLILGGACLAGLATWAAHGDGGSILAIWLLWGLLFVWQGWKVAIWWRKYFVVTQNRLMLITSLIFADVAMMPLAKVTDMRLRESAIGRLLGYGEFIIESAGRQQTLSHITFVPNPAGLYQEILSLTFPEKPAAAGPRGSAGPSWPDSPSRSSGGEPSKRPGDDPGF
jgi:uncharacterized membrane protein YdbT with pleckstrin-like domain